MKRLSLLPLCIIIMLPAFAQRTDIGNKDTSLRCVRIPNSVDTSLLQSTTFIVRDMKQHTLPNTTIILARGVDTIKLTTNSDGNAKAYNIPIGKYELMLRSPNMAGLIDKITIDTTIKIYQLQLVENTRNIPTLYFDISCDRRLDTSHKTLYFTLPDPYKLISIAIFPKHIDSALGYRYRISGNTVSVYKVKVNKKYGYTIEKQVYMHIMDSSEVAEAKQHYISIYNTHSKPSYNDSAHTQIVLGDNYRCATVILSDDNADQVYALFRFINSMILKRKMHLLMN